MTEQGLRRFLSPSDSAFLDFETSSQPLHIGSCMIYRGLLTRDEVLAAIRARLSELQRYRQRVIETPLRVSYPMWVDDPDFDPENHVEELTLPAGLDRKAIGREVGRCFEGQLDRRRPLWKIVLLHGLECGHTVLVWKVHHAMVDGLSGVDLMMILNDLTREGEPREACESPARSRELPSASRRLTDGVEHRFGEVASQWADSLYEMLDPSRMAFRLSRLRELAESMLPGLLAPAPKTPLNGPLGERRDYAAIELSFTDFRTIRSQLGGTVNDVVLAVLSGGLGRYLRDSGTDTEELELKALCPVNMRRVNERGDLGNLVSGLIVPLFVGIEDPVRRFKAARETMNALKRSGQARALYELTRMGRNLPPSWQWLAGQLPMQGRLINTVSSNVAGPQIPLYLAGHELLSWYPMGPVSADVGLFVATMSYNRKITIGLTVDLDLVPDVWALARDIEQSYTELYAAVQPRPDRTREEARGSEIAAPSSFAVFPASGEGDVRELVH